MSLFTARDLIYEEVLFDSHRLLKNRTSGVKEDEHWLCIGGDFNRLPPKSAASRFHRWSLGSLDTEDDKHLRPPWYSLEYPHLAYLPDASFAINQMKHDSSIKVAWMYRQYGGMDISLFMESSSPSGGMRESLWRAIEEDFEIVTEVLQRLEGITGLRTGARDFTYSPSVLRYAEGRHDCLQGIWQARSHICGMISAVSFHLHYLDPPTRSRFERIYDVFFRGWMLNGPKLGTRINPNDRNMSAYPLLKLVDDGCPLYLPWDYQYRPTTSIETRRAFRTLTDQEYAHLIDLAFPLPSMKADPSPPNTLFDHAIDLAAACRCVFGDTASPSSFPHYDGDIVWSTKVLDHGFLLLAPAAEMRLRHFSLVHPEGAGSIAAQLLTFALSRGIPFIIGFPSSSSSILGSATWRSSPPVQINGTITATYIRKGLTHASGWSYYLARVRNILSRPESGGILMSGGIIARIALEFGPEDLLQRLLNGPSQNAYPIPTHSHLFSDQATDLACAVLVGYVEASSGGILLSWFPPPDLLNEYMGSTWEWTAAYEEWFCMRMKTIETMSLDARPLSRSEWSHTLKAHAWRIVPPRSCFPPADNSLDDLKERFRSVCGGYHGEHYAGRKLSLFRTATIVSGPASFNIAW